MRRWFLLAVIAAGLGGTGYWFVQTQSQARPDPAAQAAPAAPRAVPVRLATVTPKDTPLLLRTIGTVQPMASVAIRARVDSVVEQVHFAEGQEVKAGDPLFTLDTRTYDAALALAQANLERDRANLFKAQADVRRTEELVRSNAIARQQLDAATAAANALEATIKADQAQIDTAKLSLSFTRIVAPMDGRTGAVTAKPGAMVRASEATPLVTINRLRPILASFNVPDRNLPALRAAMAAGPVPVEASIRDQASEAVKGTLSFIDAQVDQSSGTILAKAQFDNDGTRLWPGAFVDVTVTLSVDAKALTLPDVAVQTGQKGRFVFAVKPDDTVEVRPVTVSRIQDGVAIVGEGLQPGDRVVIEGQSRLVPGAKVVDRAKDGDPAKGGKGQGGKPADAAKGGPA
jgi:membrane fusion protein, multidrug efflux system